MRNRVFDYRKKCGLTQRELAQKAQISRVYLSQIETGAQQIISNVIMFKIANALGSEIGDIFLQQ